MGFTVSYQKNSGITVKDEFGDEGVYDFVEGGVLKIVSPDAGKKTSYTSPAVWQSVSADENHGPGSRKRGATAAPRTAAPNVDTSRDW